MAEKYFLDLQKAFSSCPGFQFELDRIEKVQPVLSSKSTAAEQSYMELTKLALLLGPMKADFQNRNMRLRKIDARIFQSVSQEEVSLAECIGGAFAPFIDKAAPAGNNKNVFLGLASYYGLGCPEDQKSALTLLRQEIKSPIAHFLQGKWFFEQRESRDDHDPAADEGQQIREEAEAALNHILQAAETLPAAMSFLGKLYQKGMKDLLKKDEKESAQWYHKALTFDDPEALYAEFQRLHQGGTTREKQRANQYLARAAAAGQAEALTIKGRRELNQQHFSTAKELFYTAARFGQAAAQRWLTYLMDHEGNDKEALHWCAQGAAGGDSEAQCMLGQA